MPAHGCGVLAVAVLISSIATASNTTYQSPSFAVEAPTLQLATAIASRAELLRTEIAREWLGKELPVPARPCAIKARLTAGSRQAQTLPGRHGAAATLWLAGAADELLGPSLAHEVAHTVLADAYGPDLPAWVNEGIASRYDDPQLKATRERYLRDFAVERTWPDIDTLLVEPVRTPRDYAAAESLTAYLLTMGSAERLLEFAADGRQGDWDAALRSNYRIGQREELAVRWQRWVTAEVVAQRIAGRDSQGNYSRR